MISFKNFLTESKSAPLFHGTDFMKGISALMDGLKPVTNQLKPKLLKTPRHADDRYESISGVSTTRMKDFALRWAKEVSERKDSLSYMVIELDQTKLGHNFEVKPIQYWGSVGSRVQGHVSRYNEFEEFIIANKPIAPKYFKRVYYFISVNQGRTPSDAMQTARRLAIMLGEIRKKHPQIEFVRLAGGEPID